MHRCSNHSYANGIFTVSSNDKFKSTAWMHVSEGNSRGGVGTTYTVTLYGVHVLVCMHS